MNVIVPGQNVVNREWAESLSQSLCIECSVFEYPWWDEPNRGVDVRSINATLAAMQPDIVVAKSIGSLFTSLALKDGLIAPKQVVMMGLPLHALSVEEIEIIQCIQGLKAIPLLMIQQANDHLGSYLEVTKRFSGSHISAIEVAGDDHLYANVEEIAQLINRWLPC